LAQPLPGASLSDGETTASVSPLLHVSGMLNVLPTLDVAALEQGMKHFLGQLQRMGEDLTAKHGGTGLGIWIVAGTAAAAACELARRQLRRSTTGLALDVPWSAGSPPEPGFGGKKGV